MVTAVRTNNIITYVRACTDITYNLMQNVNFLTVKTSDTHVHIAHQCSKKMYCITIIL